MDDHEFTKDDLEIVKWMIFVLKLSETNACIFARIGRPDILWTV